MEGSLSVVTRKRSRRVLVGGFGLVIVVVVASVLVGRATVFGGSSALPEGPLFTGTDQTATGFSVDAGRPFSFGYLYLQNHGTAPITLDAVDLVEPSAGLQVKAAVVLDLKDATHGVSGTSLEFPPTEPGPYHYLPLAGAILPPGSGALDGMNVQLGLEVAQNGDFYAREIAIRYHIGKDVYRKLVPYSLHFCAPNRLDVPCETSGS